MNKLLLIMKTFINIIVFPFLVPLAVIAVVIISLVTLFFSANLYPEPK